jgi:hypothetical protein
LLLLVLVVLGLMQAPNQMVQTELTQFLVLLLLQAVVVVAGELV